jgi:hypothetical protein
MRAAVKAAMPYTDGKITKDILFTSRLRWPHREVAIQGLVADAEGTRLRWPSRRIRSSPSRKMSRHCSNAAASSARTSRSVLMISPASPVPKRVEAVEVGEPRAVVELEHPPGLPLDDREDQALLGWEVVVELGSADACRATELLVVGRVDALGVDQFRGVFEDARSGRLALARELLRRSKPREWPQWTERKWPQVWASSSLKSKT